MLAHAKNWPQHWVDEADAEYIDELLTFLNAVGDHDATEADLNPKVREARAKHRRIRRKVELMKRTERE